ncbi:MAG: PBSX family phage terminase large subunit [Oscillospiraceae bacterium]|nr:PBSX family phage terminase large subunit [Oscillospiraceae bacterium]
MMYRSFSKRQMLAMTWWNRPGLCTMEGILCDGAIRSGKTLSMVTGFFLWSMTVFRGRCFGLCGRTIGALRRNIVGNLHDWLGDVLEIRENRSENKLVVTDREGRQNTYYLFGGQDESAYKLIQGITLAGVLLDEAALMPRSFVEQACARCSVAGSKLWFNCNPEGPEHWLYKEWICKAKEKSLLHLHFTMEDNPGLDPAIKERYEAMYTGVFYRRYVLGQWCMAEGLVYDFQPDRHIVQDIPSRGRYYISVDYGTRNPFSAGLWCVDRGRAVRIREFYHSGRETGRMYTDEEYHSALVELAGGLPVETVVVDPSAASFIATIRAHGVFAVRKAKNEVLNGIRLVAELLREGVLQFSPACTDTLREFSLYRWEENGEMDRVWKENDHAMDDIRYFCATILRRDREIRSKIGGNGNEKMVTE